MNAAAGRPSHCVTPSTRLISAIRAERRFVSRDGLHPNSRPSSAPGQAPLPPLLVKRSVQLREIPAQTLVCSRFGSETSPTSTVDPIRNSSGAIASQRSMNSGVLARRRIPHSQPLHRPTTQSVITLPLRVENRGLLPQQVGQLVPAETASSSLLVQRVVQGFTIKRRARLHAYEATSATRNVQQRALIPPAVGARQERTAMPHRVRMVGPVPRMKGPRVLTHL